MSFKPTLDRLLESFKKKLHRGLNDIISLGLHERVL
jgi:hypothetical protein